jgi:hypothetical protein
MPGASQALTNATLPFGLALANMGFATVLARHATDMVYSV